MEPSEQTTALPPFLDYLRVNAFLQDMVTARALTTAFELGLVDHLLETGHASHAALQQATRTSADGLQLLLTLLLQGMVIETDGTRYRLCQEFRAALQYRDLMLAKLDFSHIAAHDVIDSFSYIVTAPTVFMQRSGMFRLFNYGNALENNTANRMQTARWMRITSTLTRYEAHACFHLHDFRRHRTLLDVGGNSGEFSRQACRTHPHLRATVFDLPVVCELGREYLRGAPEAERIGFIAGNLKTDRLPSGHDLVLFKSVLHDWPETQVRIFLENACCELQPGGTLVIFERGPFTADTAGVSYADLPIMVFAHTLRTPELYCACLHTIGMQQVNVQWIELEMPFFMVTGVKP